MPVFLIVLGTVALVTALSIARGFVLSYLWQWFLVPLGLPAISISHAIGISLIVGYLTYEGSATNNKDLVEAITASVVQLVLPFAIGWLVHLIMIG